MAKNQFVSIASSVGGITLAMVAVILVFANDHAWLVAPVVACMAFMGTMLGFFAKK